jgi:flagellar protein FliS
MSVDPKREYRETAVRNAAPVRLILILYEAAIEDLRRVSAAMEDHDVQRRTDEAHHFLEVLNQLQGSLDMERGGEVAANLDRYYTLARSQLFQAVLNNSSETVNNMVSQFLSLHQAWLEVERATAVTANDAGSEAAPRSTAPEKTASPASEPSAPTKEWSA